MSEGYDDELVTSHSDENPELGEGGGNTVELMSSEEGSATDDLYKNKEKRLGVRPDENVIYYEEFVPEVDHDSR
jgi:hypothetical protein